jgi:membrane protease subunit HflC
MKLNLRWLAAGAILLGLYIIGSTFYVLRESELALLIRLGAPSGVIDEPGLKLKIPFIDSLVFYDGRLQTLLPPTEQVILGDQKRIEVETYAHFRISDPLRFYQAVRTLEQANAELTQMISSSLRRELGQVQLLSLLSVQRQGTVAKIEKDVADRASALGIEVTEVRLHRADLPAETSQAIYDRMTSERQREAKELRAQGFEWAQQIQAKADSERTVLLSQAQRQANITRGDADADANRTLSAAFSKDPQFYRLYRSLQTYRQSLADTQPTLILTPDAAFLKQFTTGPAGAAGAK